MKLLLEHHLKQNFSPLQAFLIGVWLDLRLGKCILISRIISVILEVVTREVVYASVVIDQGA